MYQTKLGMNEKLTMSNEFLTIVQTHPEYRQALNAAGITEQQLQEAGELLQKARSSNLKKNSGKGDRLAARQQFNVNAKKCKKTLRSLEILAGILFRDYPELMTKFGWEQKERVESSVIGWLSWAISFYRCVLETPAILEKFIGAGIAQEVLSSSLQTMLDLEDFYTHKVVISADTKKLTRDQNADFKALDRIMIDFQKIARVVFSDDLTALEKFGFALVGQFAPRRKKKQNTTTNSQPAPEYQRVLMPHDHGIE